jgi:hypothetical protein
MNEAADVLTQCLGIGVCHSLLERSMPRIPLVQWTGVADGAQKAVE